MVAIIDKINNKTQERARKLRGVQETFTPDGRSYAFGHGRVLTSREQGLERFLRAHLESCDTTLKNSTSNFYTI